MEGTYDCRQQDYWDKRWDEGRTGWHKDNGDELLHKYIDTFTAGRTGIKIFFPLCGKAFDMKWLADLGHKVVGVEYSSKPIMEFFKEHSLQYSVETCSNTSLPVYRSNDKKISIYNCDLFTFSSAAEGVFDAIWDAGSLVAINKSDRDRYAELMLSLMSKDGVGCRYMLSVLEYNEEYYPGPPCNISEDTIQHLYNKQCDISSLEVIKLLEVGQKRFSEKFTYFNNHVYLVQPKK